MKKLTFIGYLFGAAGIVMLVVAGILFEKTDAFIASSVTGAGTVIDLVLEQSTTDSGSSRRTSTTYHPVVRFTASSGETIEFKSSYGSNPPSYRKGEAVTVRYLPDDPYQAKIDSFFSLWGAPSIITALGCVFAGFGIAVVVSGILTARKEKGLLQSGQTITAAFQSVEQNRSVRMNNRYPYRIVSQWHNPETNTVYVFKSKNIWFNPEQFIQSKEIRVLIDPRNPKRYVMDVSFLPEMAE